MSTFPTQRQPDAFEVLRRERGDGGAEANGILARALDQRARESGQET